MVARLKCAAISFGNTKSTWRAAMVLAEWSMPLSGQKSGNYERPTLWSISAHKVIWMCLNGKINSGQTLLEMLCCTSVELEI